MTRHKTRKITAILKLCILLILPAVVAVSAKGIPKIKNFLNTMGNISIENTTTSIQTTVTSTFTQTTTKKLLKSPRVME